LPFLARLLEGLAQTPCKILLGEGHTDQGIGLELLLTLPLWKRDSVVLVPSSLSLEAYTALIDWSDVFISGDTGPLHLAAAWKSDREGRHGFRNRTAVLSIFGATPPRFSGYDSAPGFMESEQRAESHSYQSVSTCRNLTCMHKMAKDCDASGCFQDLDVEQIITHAQNLLKRVN
jgi:ADP-heptose:LPS heptosyltransferase